MVAEIAIISGKGGTGKTTISAAFAAISGNLVTADCDVDAPDLHILLRPKIEKTLNYQGTKVASINPEKCTECGLCADKCRFDAARPPELDQIMCEGCGVCAHVCPEEAIEMKVRISGYLYESKTLYGPMSHAQLLPGEGNSGKLVTEVRNQSRKMAGANGNNLILIDGSPGIGCPVIAAVTGIHLAVIVTEPTMSGMHDMKRVLELLQRFQVKPMVIINKFDLNAENAELIEQYCRENEVELLGNIPFDSVMTKSMVAAKTLPEFAPNHELTKGLKHMWGRITATVSG